MKNKLFIMDRIKKLLICLFILFPVNNKALSYQEPKEMLENITQEVINKLNIKEDIDNNSGYDMNKDIYKIINKHIIPNIDLVEMSRWIMGKAVWQKSTKEEKNKFMNAFKHLLIENYYVTLNDYKKHDIKFIPMKEKYTKKKHIVINSLVTNKLNNEVLRINYRLIRKNKKWKIFDIVVEDISLLKTYQSQLKSKIRKYGIKKVTSDILLSSNIKKYAK